MKEFVHVYKSEYKNALRICNLPENAHRNITERKIIYNKANYIRQIFIFVWFSQAILGGLRATSGDI